MSINLNISTNTTTNATTTNEEVEDLDTMLELYYLSNTIIDKPIYDLNSNLYDSQLHVNKLLHDKNTIKDLLVIDNNLILNIKELYSEQQMIVYENYNKYIAATDTIHSMKSHVEKIDMKLLNNNMLDIKKLSSNLEKSFSSNLNNYQNLVSTRKQLNRLQFILQLPKILETELYNNNFNNVIDNYISVYPALQSYIHLNSFNKISSDTEIIIMKTKKILRTYLRDSSIESNILCDYAVLLLKVSENADSILPEIIESRRAYFINIIQGIITNANSSSKLTAILNDFFNKYVSFVSNFKDLFYNEITSKTVFVLLAATTKELLNSCFQLCRKILLENFNNQPLSKEYTVEFLKDLSLIYNATHSLNELLPASNTVDKATALIEYCVRHYIESKSSNVFSAIKALMNKFHEYLKTSNFVEADSISTEFDIKSVDDFSFNGNVSQRLTEIFATLFMQTLDCLSPIAGRRSPNGSVEPSSSVIDSCELVSAVSDLVSIQVFKWYKYILDATIGDGSPDSYKLGKIYLVGRNSSNKLFCNDNPSFYLIFSNVFKLLSMKYLNTTQQQLQLYFPQLLSSKNAAVDYNNLSQEVEDTTSLMLSFYVDYFMSLVAKEVIPDFDFSSKLEVISHRPYILQILNIIKDFDNTYCKVIGRDISHKPVAASGISKSYKDAQINIKSNKTASDFDRLFSKRIIIYTPPKLELPTSSLYLFLKLLLKHFVEKIRLNSLSEKSYLQLQNDIHYLSDRLPVLPNEYRADIDSLSNEILMSAKERIRTYYLNV